MARHVEVERVAQRTDLTDAPTGQASSHFDSIADEDETDISTSVRPPGADRRWQRGRTVDNAIWGMLNDAEQALLRDAEPDALGSLDEDGLAALHDRIRRARNKYSKLYRRRAAAEVQAAGARSKGHDRHARTVIKAEAFEEALARVSQHLARVAKASAAELKAERIALAKAAKGAGQGEPTAGAGKVGSGRATVASRRKPADERSNASTRSTNKRKQAARDER